MSESYRRYGTIAFDHSVMREQIRLTRDGALPGQGWLATVPTIYRRSVMVMVSEVLGTLRTQRYQPPSTVEFIARLHQRIWSGIEPINQEDVERRRIEIVERLLSQVIAGEANIAELESGHAGSNALTQITILNTDISTMESFELVERMATYWVGRLDAMRKR